MDTNTYSSPPSIKFYPFPSHYFTPSSALYPCKSIFSLISDIVRNTSLFKAYRGYWFSLKQPSSGHTETINSKLHTFSKVDHKL